MIFHQKTRNTVKNITWSELNHPSLSKRSTVCTGQDLGREHGILLSVTQMFCVKPRSHCHDCGTDCPRRRRFSQGKSGVQSPEFNFPMNAYNYSTFTLRMSTNSVRFGSRFRAVLTRCVTIYYDYSTIQCVSTAVVPGTRYECRRRLQTIIHVLLAFHLRVYYDFSRLTYEQSRLHDSIRFKATRVYGGPDNYSSH